MSPPVLARALLLAVVCEPSVAGDLEEEFQLVCKARDCRAAKRWYRWQVLRSLTPFTLSRLRSSVLPSVALGALLRVALPLLLLDRLWSFVYSQIPLKDGMGRAPELLALNLLAACVGAAFHRRGWSSCAAAVLALWLSHGASPALYLSLVLVLTPAASACRRRA